MPSQRETAPSSQQAFSGQRVPRIPGKYAIAEGCCRKIQNGPSMVLRLGTLNVGSLTGRSMEIAEMLERRRIDISCIQETRWKSNGVCHVISDKEKYKLFWNGQKTAKNGVGIFVRKPLAQEVLDIKRINSRLICSWKLDFKRFRKNFLRGKTTESTDDDSFGIEIWPYLQHEFGK
ncbi:hypothetical protein HELRODRAFT_162974 [Helobdella robusta]|uniref:Endonuclease/exonuclease/phosphatase domain-containing protein n=1 Tax=Helobdella robusta TaxID=6412 RepID=T1ETG9_HELRO|nr:hypothetical protein HELRODRAFT_162974 [Helobdella robusta]ESN99426.1 hypothetical protein HELRODRAFT_162974 [Helobdella robusta]